jgi:outer membrane protein OmpA-like peptidoglycan-associated protein
LTAFRALLLVLFLAVPTALTVIWVGSAKARLAEAEQEVATRPQQAAVAAATDDTYCSPPLKKILRRVLQSCGLLGSRSGRGCQPLEAKNVATVSGDDFNALFQPMKNRGGIVQFDQAKADLLPGAQSLVDTVFADQRGASYFFVVARASPEGAVTFNRELSRRRAEAVMAYLKQKFQDPDLEKEVGLLWLGEEFAQLDREFCDWKRSGGGDCVPADINRSAFIAWIDCRL